MKRTSDEFDVAYQRVTKEQLARGRTEAQAQVRGEAPVSYEETFYVHPDA